MRTPLKRATPAAGRMVTRLKGHSSHGAGRARAVLTKTSVVPHEGTIIRCRKVDKHHR
jgi:hypothetical protein